MSRKIEVPYSERRPIVHFRAPSLAWVETLTEASTGEGMSKLLRRATDRELARLAEGGQDDT